MKPSRRLAPSVRRSVRSSDAFRRFSPSRFDHRRRPAGEEPVIPIETLAPATAEVPPVPVPHAAQPAPRPACSDATRSSGAFSGFDELAFLQSVVDRPRSNQSRVLRHAATGAASSRVGPSYVRSRRARDDRAGGVSRCRRQTNARIAPSQPAPTPVLTSAPLVERDVQEPDSSLTPGSIPAFLKDVPTEQIKTLKCQECGTMNYPTEWYCERCGASSRRCEAL